MYGVRGQPIKPRFRRNRRTPPLPFLLLETEAPENWAHVQAAETTFDGCRSEKQKHKRRDKWQDLVVLGIGIRVGTWGERRGIFADSTNL